MLLSHNKEHIGLQRSVTAIMLSNVLTTRTDRAKSGLALSGLVMGSTLTMASVLYKRIADSSSTPLQGPDRMRQPLSQAANCLRTQLVLPLTVACAVGPKSMRFSAPYIAAQAQPFNRSCS